MMPQRARFPMELIPPQQHRAAACSPDHA
jgi:hypothetical protein